MSTALSLWGDADQHDGVKSLVPGAARGEMFVVAAQMQDAGPALFLVAAGATGALAEAERPWASARRPRGASTSRA